jgi:hypothetical protein
MIGSRSVLPSSKHERQTQEREDGGPVRMGEVFDLLFREKAA